MLTPVILSIDEGTTNAKAVCVDKNGQILSRGSCALSISHPFLAWAEQDPLEIISAIKTAVSIALESTTGVIIEGIAVSNQRESVLVWDRKSGLPLSSVVSWQCRRSQEYCEQLSKSGYGDIIQKKTGLPIDPLFPAAKIKLLLDSIPDARKKAVDGDICVGTIDSWIVWHLSNGKLFTTDPSNASRTQLFNIANCEWDNELLDIFDIPFQCLATIQPSASYRGVTSGFGTLSDGIPILSQIGDSHAALYGQGGFIPGVVKATYGTGSSLMTPITHNDSNDYRLGRTVAWHDGELSYALEGNITHTGSGVAWMSRMLSINDVGKLTEMASSLSGNQGVYFVPALSGLGAPHWNSAARGVISGLTDNCTPATLARAALESVAYQVADVFHLMEEISEGNLDTLLVDGGPTKSNWLMQFQADLLQRPIIRSEVAEVSALGAAYLAGKAAGWWKLRDDLVALSRQTHIIHPSKSTQVIKDSYDEWRTAVQRSLLT